MKAIIILLGTLSLITACGPSANFSSEDARFKSLMNGETVEVVDSDSLESILGNSDTSNSTIDTGVSNQETRDNSVPTDVVNPKKPDNLVVVKNDDDDDENQSNNRNDNGVDKKNSDKDEMAHRGCKDRLLDQDKKEKHDEMVTSPKELNEDQSASKILSCGNKSDKKVLVCHFPNADYSKRKTLCIGKAALDAHLNHLGAKRGSDHVDFAGACQTDTEKEVEKDNTDNLL